MNASATRGRWATLLLAALWLPAWSQTQWASDPLRTLPAAAIARGPLPGDGDMVACPTSRDAAQPLSLALAIDLALCRNPQIRGAWVGIKLQAGALGEARAAFLPKLNGNLSRVNDQTSSADGRLRSNVRSNTLHAGVDWRIADFGGRSANQAAAEDMLAAAIASQQAAVQGVMSSVVQTYYDAQSAYATWDARVQSEAMATDTVTAATRREAQGVTGHTDTLQAITALAKATIEKNRAYGQWLRSAALLNFALGDPDAGVPLLPSALDEQAQASVPDLRQWLDQVRQTHPAIVAARAQLSAARGRITAVRSEGRPTLDVSLNYYRNGRPDQSLQAAASSERTLGLMLTVPIFDGFASRYRVAGAEAQAEQKEVELDQTVQQVLTDVIKAHADAAASLDNLDASSQLRTAAQDALDSSRRRYAHGAADILEILNAQSALADARQERVRCLADWRSARLRLLASVAQMGRVSAAP
ncbi:TolC family protein [Duganella sp. FT94W]|uniref:Protein CyaE n=1 Tax=Duganella lactea TaxID=2692173 RepID=A0ABW9VFR9_9BURK|nr:TolC family protein [Duganella lactea]MYM37525.1 TolC family protein [Duganella lactea]